MYKKILNNSLILTVLISGMIFLTGCTQAVTTQPKTLGIPNPWTDCGKDFECAAKAAGIQFPLVKFNVRAMKDMIEVDYPLDSERTLIVRKTTENSNEGDMAGVYIDYPVNKKIKLDNGVSFKIRGTKNLINVAYFSAESGYYSLYCEKGFTKKELEKFYEVLAELEAPKDIK